MLSKEYRFESERLAYAGITEKDAEQIVAWRSDPENYRNFFNAAPITIEQHLAWFKRYLSDDSRFDFLISTLEGDPVGTCGIVLLGDGCAEISYMIGALAARGRGYAKEAVGALSEVAFSELGATRVIARILPHNAASMAVVAAQGFVECERVYELVREPGESA